MCRTNDSVTQTQGEGHTSRSWDLPLMFVYFKSLQPFVRFSLNITQMFLSVSWCAEPMTQLCKLKVKVTLQGHRLLRRVIWLTFRLLSCCCLTLLSLMEFSIKFDTVKSGWFIVYIEELQLKIFKTPFFL